MFIVLEILPSADIIISWLAMTDSGRQCDIVKYCSDEIMHGNRGTVVLFSTLALHEYDLLLLT